MITKAQRQHKIALNIAKLQDDLSANWVDRSIPEGWNFLETSEPIEPHKTKITMRVDTDMLRWFKKMGPQYQRRLNQVLRVYYTAMVQGDLETHWAFSEQRELSSQYLDAVLDRYAEED